MEYEEFEENKKPTVITLADVVESASNILGPKFTSQELKTLVDHEKFPEPTKFTIEVWSTTEVEDFFRCHPNREEFQNLLNMVLYDDPF